MDNRLTINYSKTSFIIFHTRNKKVPNDLKEIKVGNISISRVEETKYLGLFFDESLTWKSHVYNLCKNLVRFFGIFEKNRNSINLNLAGQLYYAFIYSRINYGIQIYGSCSSILIKKIQTLSNRLLKFLLKFDIRTPTLDLHKYMNILTVNDIKEVNILNFVRNCLQDDCPEIFRSYFVYPPHRHALRDPALYIQPHRTTMVSMSVQIKDATLGNKLPTHIKNKSRLKSFRNILRIHYISKY